MLKKKKKKLFDTFTLYPLKKIFIQKRPAARDEHICIIVACQSQLFVQLDEIGRRSDAKQLARSLHDRANGASSRFSTEQ